MTPHQTSLHSQSTLVLLGTALAVVVAALALYDPPGPAWLWLAGSAAFLAVDRFAPGSRAPAGGAGWLVVVAMAAGLRPVGVLFAATATVLVGVALDASRRRSLVVATGRFLAQVLPAGAVVAVAALAPPSRLWAALLAGAVAGIGAQAMTRLVLPAVDTTFAGRPQRRSLVTELGEAAFLGATVAVAGSLLPVAGWVAAPLLLGGIAVAVAVPVTRARADAAADDAVDALLTALEAKDLYTRGHAERVAVLAATVGRDLGLHGVEMQRLVTAARLHDIGKVVVPRPLLRKRGRLDEDEYCRIQEHAEVVGEIIGGIEVLQPVVDVIVEHHRGYDGTAYGHAHGVGMPSLAARIIAACDAFDAMTTHRPYRAALSTGYAFAEMRRCAGTQFDPLVVEALVRSVERQGGWVPATGAESDDEARGRAERALQHV